MTNESSFLAPEKEKIHIASCVDLLEEFEAKEQPEIGKKLQFSGVEGKDVYNISKPFLIAGEIAITGRVESRENSADSEVKFFKLENDIWLPITNAPTLKLEDGFVNNFEGETVVGGVEVYPTPTESDPESIGYKTIFYRGHDFSSLQKFASGPEGMKDIRLAPVNGKLGVFTRPQGGSNGGGKIGYTELNNLEELTAENILKAKIIENQFAPGEWGGVNEVHPLPNGKIGIIGHIAYRDTEGIRHYYAISFIYNPENHQTTPIKIIATRKNFPAGASKTAELSDVIFPGGLVRHSDGLATLYAGLSDAEAGSIEIDDPFIETE
jgi:hypothetical protein